MYRLFNLGVGMVMACGPQGAEEAREQLQDTVSLGRVVKDREGERVGIV